MKAVLPVHNFTGIDWNAHAIRVGVDANTLTNAPSWQRGAPLTRAYEARLLAYYGEAPYWQHTSSSNDAVVAPR
jgi:hypothetical protein